MEKKNQQIGLTLPKDDILQRLVWHKFPYWGLRNLNILKTLLWMNVFLINNTFYINKHVSTDGLVKDESY